MWRVCKSSKIIKHPGGSGGLCPLDQRETQDRCPFFRSLYFSQITPLFICIQQFVFYSCQNKFKRFSFIFYFLSSQGVQKSYSACLNLATAIAPSIQQTPTPSPQDRTPSSRSSSDRKTGRPISARTSASPSCLWLTWRGQSGPPPQPTGARGSARALT